MAIRVAREVQGAVQKTARDIKLIAAQVVACIAFVAGNLVFLAAVEPAV